MHEARAMFSKLLKVLEDALKQTSIAIRVTKWLDQKN